mmetsp:Transcript_29860/g.75129  ORF Transcript_29860/g.75129 Transcript_29860/m.75129 type:complete len:175 (-) Transcript_29860:177-701(-)|eukprot:CAMPEP_0177628672 /NCGR_PEP_ID=MMETSP0447-20121125/256_1 /TAXON_ID=0 /ORGANISM="Stygamoeba regulata, Strain BSH-02190019" /LENGTH=174 /DNA_ID=CAMNT_0019129935 /DNA_START=83 /DNA_END=607 /DNA_ORIENTATION=+
MQKVALGLLLLALFTAVLGECVQPPEGLSVCQLAFNARVPREFATLTADRDLVSLLDYYREIDHLPTYDCAEAYTDFKCSQAYPRCTGDSESGLGTPVNVCWSACDHFVRKCRNQLPGVPRPDCGKFSTEVDCTYNGKHPRKIDISEWYGSGAGSMTAGLFAVMSSLVLSFLFM